MSHPAAPSLLPAPASAASPAFAADVLDGLAATPKTLPSKYFYDERGSRLFDQITRLDAYYPTRVERGILQANADALVDAIGRQSALVEYGSGSSDKTRILLGALHARRTLAAYVPIDISEDYLLATAERLRLAYPSLPVLPVAADYTQPFALPDLPDETRRRVVFFPGSTVGNFSPDEAAAFFRQAAAVAGPGGALLIGADQAPSRSKPVGVLLRAYDDDDGVTAAFNRNLLRRINEELGADFDLDGWAHEARWNDDACRIEMHLRSLRDQTAHVCGRAISFHADETIHTENSHKYGPDRLAALAAPAGFTRAMRWTDPDAWFAVELYHTD